MLVLNLDDEDAARLNWLAAHWGMTPEEAIIEVMRQAVAEHDAKQKSAAKVNNDA
jgi:plasmid stability protein